MDRGVPTEAVLAEMRAADPPVQYLVGTPKGRLTRLEKGLVDKPWHDARPGVQVKLLPQDGELYVFAQSTDRVAKERAIRRRQLKWLWGRLKQLAGMKLSREELLMRLGAARKPSPDGLASNRNRGRCGQRRTQLSPRSREAAPRPAARGPVSLAHQSHRR